MMVQMGHSQRIGTERIGTVHHAWGRMHPLALVVVVHVLPWAGETAGMWNLPILGGLQQQPGYHPATSM